MSPEESTRNEWSVHYWRWRNFLVQFNTLGSEGPPIVFIHGFGAFGEHYRENIKGLAAKGYHTWALTLLGFGRSEKPNIVYTELLWAELIRDFILEVVHEPVILAGNSIGGYMVSCVAGLWPSLVKSLVLINTAGAVVPDYLSLKYVKGVNDPLSRVTNRARALESSCQNVVVKLMDAGHCPHDEVADELNTVLLEWLQHLELMKNQ